MSETPSLFPDLYRSPAAEPAKPEPAAPIFDGSTYVERLDGERLAGQLGRVLDLMRDHEWRTLAEIAQAAGGSEAGVSARLRDLRKDEIGGRCGGPFNVEGRRRTRSIWEYRIAPAGGERAA